MSKKLTPKQAKLVQGIAEGKTQREAYIEAYDTKGNIPTVDAEASKTISKPQVQEAIEQAMVKLNLTPERVLKPIDDALNDDDVKTRLMGSDRALKLMGADKKSEGNTINNFGNILLDQRDKYSE